MLMYVRAHRQAGGVEEGRGGGEASQPKGERALAAYAVLHVCGTAHEGFRVPGEGGQGVASTRECSPLVHPGPQV